MSIQSGEALTESINGKRYYKFENNKFPSVTTIIGEFSDKEWLKDWRKKVGEEAAERISTFSANRGSVMHQMLEYYLEYNGDKSQKLKYTQDKIVEYVEAEGYTKREYDIGRGLFNKIYSSGTLDRIKKILYIEETLYSTKYGGYAGRCDAIFLNHDNKIIILDFKTSKKEKSHKDIKGYYLQISAYYLAFWERFGRKPNGGEIWIAIENEIYPQIVEIDDETIKKCLVVFLNMVKKFHNKYPVA